jgi:hypothetical protein
VGAAGCRVNQLVFVIVDGDVTTPRLYFKTGRESFQLIRWPCGIGAVSRPGSRRVRGAARASVPLPLPKPRPRGYDPRRDPEPSIEPRSRRYEHHLNELERIRRENEMAAGSGTSEIIEEALLAAAKR